MELLKLCKPVVDGIVSNGLVGVYCLGEKSPKGFHVGYVGRSDTDLRRRLLQHVQSGKFSYFYFVQTETIFDAFRIECREWHRFFELGNAIHPDAPKNLPYICPYCNGSKEIKSGLRRLSK
jgi:hypothetical protein|tara:strand:+ start:347 stop:709 length:363 start_codon:yes stop_codon:yes gene_type:complete